MIEVSQLTKRYGQTLALDHVTFTIQPGEVVGLLGPNGAGKTTMLKLLTGYLPPTEGSARVARYDIVERLQQAAASIRFLLKHARDQSVKTRAIFFSQVLGSHHHDRESTAQNFNIQPQRPVIDIFKVQAYPVFKILYLIAAADLPKAGQPGFNA